MQKDQREEETDRLVMNAETRQVTNNTDQGTIPVYGTENRYYPGYQNERRDYRDQGVHGETANLNKENKNYNQYQTHSYNGIKNFNYKNNQDQVVPYIAPTRSFYESVGRERTEKDKKKKIKKKDFLIGYLFGFIFLIFGYFLLLCKRNKSVFYGITTGFFMSLFFGISGYLTSRNY